MYVYEHEYLASEGEYVAPVMTIDTTDWDISLRKVFAEQDGSMVHALGELPGSSGALYPWVVISIDPIDIP